MKEEKLVDVIGFEGYYKISETGKIYKIRPNISCSFDILKEIKPKPNKAGDILVCLNRNGVHKYTHLKSIFHDSFFPERIGLKCKFNGGISLDNIVLLDRRRPLHDGVTEKKVLSVLKNNSKLHISEVARICMVCEERVRQIKRKMK